MFLIKSQNLLKQILANLKVRFFFYKHLNKNVAINKKVVRITFL